MQIRGGCRRGGRGRGRRRRRRRRRHPQGETFAGRRAQTRRQVRPGRRRRGSASSPASSTGGGDRRQTNRAVVRSRQAQTPAAAAAAPVILPDRAPPPTRPAHLDLLRSPTSRGRLAASRVVVVAVPRRGSPVARVPAAGYFRPMRLRVGGGGVGGGSLGVAGGVHRRRRATTPRVRAPTDRSRSRSPRGARGRRGYGHALRPFLASRPRRRRDDFDLARGGFALAPRREHLHRREPHGRRRRGRARPPRDTGVVHLGWGDAGVHRSARLGAHPRRPRGVWELIRARRPRAPPRDLLRRDALSPPSFHREDAAAGHPRAPRAEGGPPRRRRGLRSGAVEAGVWKPTRFRRRRRRRRSRRGRPDATGRRGGFRGERRTLRGPSRGCEAPRQARRDGGLGDLRRFVRRYAPGFVGLRGTARRSPRALSSSSPGHDTARRDPPARRGVHVRCLGAPLPGVVGDSRAGSADGRGGAGGGASPRELLGARAGGGGAARVFPGVARRHRRSRDGVFLGMWWFGCRGFGFGGIGARVGIVGSSGRRRRRRGNRRP